MKLIFTLLLLIGMLNTSAQRCATSSYVQQQSAFARGNGSVKPKPPLNARDTLPDEVILIPVVVHVLYNTNGQNISDEQVLSQIKVLNEDFRRLNKDAIYTPAPFKNVAADTRIVFSLAKVDPNGYATNGIIHKFTKEPFFLADDAMKFSSSGGDDAWDANKYLNIWVCDLFGRTLGYAVLPGSPPEKDGVVIKYTAFGTTGNVRAPYNKGRTTTHEIGHWLGLRHLWGDKRCGDDGIADTPSQQSGNNHCPTFPHLSSCSINQYGDMFMNFMDLTDDKCMNLFTIGQKSKMRSVFSIGNYRNSLLNSTVCDASNAQPAPIVPDAVLNKPAVTIYPNPFLNDITISLKDVKYVKGSIIKLYNATGKLFINQKVQSKETTLHLNHLPSGLYFLRIEGGQGSFAYKIIKQSNALK